MRSVYCKHFEKKAKKGPVCTYKMDDIELNICIPCERKLRKEVMEQIALESELRNMKK